MPEITDSALETRARRAARRCGLVARKSRWRRHSIDNYGGFQVINPRTNSPVAGVRYDLTAQDVIEYCGALLDAAAAGPTHAVG